MIYSLVYISKACTTLSADDLQSILQQSRENNAEAKVTGMLLYKGSEFMQVLEGEQGIIDDLYLRIEKDIRHSSCTVLSRKLIPQRLFSDWTMGFKNIENEQLLAEEGVSSFFDLDCDQDDFLQSATAFNLLRRFYSADET